MNIKTIQMPESKDSCNKYFEWTEGLDMRLKEIMMAMMIHAHFLAGHNKAFFYILRYSDAIYIFSTLRQGLKV